MNYKRAVGRPKKKPGDVLVDDLLRMAERLAENAETLPPDHQRAILQAFGVRVTADGRAWKGEITT